MELKGRTALVSGASSGIGAATVAKLARRGMRVLATGRNPAALEELASRTGAVFLAADLGRAEEIERVASWTGEVDLLVNNAGIGWAGPLSAIPPNPPGGRAGSNSLARARLSGCLLPGMIERERGNVVNIASFADILG